MTKLKPDWRALFDSEAEARYELDRLAHDGKPPVRRFASGGSPLKISSTLTVSLLWRMNRPEPPPAELALVLSAFAGYLAVGQIPDPIKEAATEGRRPPGPTERRHIGWAVVYRHACRPEGITHKVETIHMADKSPVKTLAAWFEVDPNVIRKWVRDHPPVFMGVNAVNSEVIIKRTRAAGETYSRAGRGQRAVTRRNSLTRPPQRMILTTLVRRSSIGASSVRLLLCGANNSNHEHFHAREPASSLSRLRRQNCQPA